MTFRGSQSNPHQSGERGGAGGAGRTWTRSNDLDTLGKTGGEHHKVGKEVEEVDGRMDSECCNGEILMGGGGVKVN